jgi:hypothetical protein
MTTIRQLYENTKAKGEKYLDCPVLLCLPPNTTIEPDAYYEIDFKANDNSLDERVYENTDFKEND